MSCICYFVYSSRNLIYITVSDHKLVYSDRNFSTLFNLQISLGGYWEDLKDKSDDIITAWEPPSHILWSVDGIDAGSTMRPWYSAKQVSC